MGENPFKSVVTSQRIWLGKRIDILMVVFTAELSCGDRIEIDSNDDGDLFVFNPLLRVSQRYRN